MDLRSDAISKLFLPDPAGTILPERMAGGGERENITLWSPLSAAQRNDDVEFYLLYSVLYTHDA